jgi:outer membrane receptor protein involved in Fe transport
MRAQSKAVGEFFVMGRTRMNRSSVVVGASLIAIGTSLMVAAPAHAQAAGQPNESPAEEAGAGETGNENEIVVTGSRIERAGFDQPTPTTVLGTAEIRQSAQQSLQQVLNEQPQVRNTVNPSATVANTGSGTAPVDLRGLGSSRTLTLVNGRRFVGNNNLNFVPINLVERVEVVTGGASAAWGSDAVAGVVNIILNDDLEGVTLGASSGISTRGDGFQYSVEGAFGTHFAGGNGHFMVGAEYLRNKGIGSRGMNSRPYFGADFVNIGNGQRELRPNVSTNLIVAGSPITFGGTILTGALAGRVFNPDGTIRVNEPNDALNVFETLILQSPLERLGSYARLSYDVGAAKFWVDAAYGRTNSNQPFLPDTAGAVLATSISASNPFLNTQIREQLAAAGQTSFLLGRLSRDTFFLTFDAERETREIAVGVDGELGSAWKYSAHFSRGDVKSQQRLENSSIPANFARALNAVNSNGQIVCAVNADADPSNNDPGCVPFNPFGEGAASAAATNYVRGTQSLESTTKLDSAAVEIQGDPFSLWAGPVTIAVGAEARWEKQSQQNGELDRANSATGGSIFGTTLFRNPVNGGFNVKEVFAEALVPLLDTDMAKFEVNGAARYSDYSRSGGIWSWKVGGTARLFESLLLRATRSRDIRAPNISELFSVGTLNLRVVNDRDRAGREGTPGYNPTPQIRLLSGGDPNLVPEISKTTTLGGSFSPNFLQGFNLSVDYYNIKIGRAIQVPDTADITLACAAGDAEACARVTRNASGTITEVRATFANIASLRTSGFDIEASYLLPMSRLSNLPGTLRFRALATYVKELVFETPSSSRDAVGSVGDTVLSGIPHWRGNFSATYQSDVIGLDARIRYVGGGKFDAAQTNIVNNSISARTYLDLGAQFKVTDQFTFFTHVRNVLDEDPPLMIQLGGANYDTIGRYFTTGVRLSF